MKAHYHKVPIQIQESFSIRHNIQSNFGNVWHYHPELELHYVIKGEGVRLIGDNLSNFKAGELLFLGENLPHTWHCQEEYFKGNPENNVEAIVLHFSPDCFGKDFPHLPEMTGLLRLFERAKRGMEILGETKKRLIPLLKSAANATDFSKVILLLQILKELAETPEFNNVSGTLMMLKANDGDMERMNRIYNYTLTHFDRPIPLEEIASVGNLTVTSFCRYFRSMTDKTYAEFLVEVRVNNACKLLTEDTMQIEEISYTCGFNNLSNFYRQFKKLTGYTPKGFRRHYTLKQ